MKRINKNKIKPIESDPIFVEKVFKRSANADNKKQLGWKDHNAIYTAIQGIIDATNDQLKAIEIDCAENNEEHFDSNAEKKLKIEEEILDVQDSSDELIKLQEDENRENKHMNAEFDTEIEKRLINLREAMHIKSVENDENSDLKSIFLEGELPHDPQILVSATETETKTERMSDYVKDAADGDSDGKMTILSGKMTISLISLTNNEEDKNGHVEQGHVGVS